MLFVDGIGGGGGDCITGEDSVDDVEGGGEESGPLWGESTGSGEDEGEMEGFEFLLFVFLLFDVSDFAPPPTFRFFLLALFFRGTSMQES
jgi:hypothetical protein